MLSLGIEDFIRYITHTFSIPASAELVRPSKEMPLYLRGNFSLFQGYIADRAITWAKVEDESIATPDRLQEQKYQLQRFFTPPVVFVFRQLDSWQRKRLIEKQVGFVQTNKQLYIPELILQLNDIRPGNRLARGRPDHVSFSTQVALLYHLQREKLDKHSALEIAAKLAYSAMTVTRIIRELQQFEWVTVHPGKERTFEFREHGEKLWELALPLLRNPIKQTWFTEVALGSIDFMPAGETALSGYTMLGESRETYLAISKGQFKSLQASQRFPELNIHQGRFCLQVWQYEPRILVEPDHYAVDRLSLYLSLKDDSDERVQAALQDMIKQIQW